MIRKYHNHKRQTTLWHSEEEPLNHHETPWRQIKQNNQLSLPLQDDCNTRTDTKQRTTKHRATTDIHNGRNNKQKVNNNKVSQGEFYFDVSYVQFSRSWWFRKHDVNWLFIYITKSQLSCDMKFPTMWYLRPAKPQISLRISAAWSELLLVTCIFFDC